MRLIRDRRRKMHLSYDRAGQLIPSRPLSPTRWRQLEDGYRTVRGIGRIPESAPPATLAGMAYVTGVTPAELHAEGCPEAADELVQLIADRARQDGSSLAEANRMVSTVPGLNAGQQRALAQEIVQSLGRIREQGR